MGPASLCGISCVTSKNESNSSTVMQITSTEFEAGTKAGSYHWTVERLLSFPREQAHCYR